MGKPRDLANVVATGNILADGAVAPAELTGVTSTAAEINILDGVTATATELNLLDGVTATTAELNYVDGVTSNVQTQMDTKAPVADPTFTGTATAPTVNASTALQIGGVAVTATAAELNIMDGVTVSASDINTVTAKAPTADPTFTGTATAPTINASTALQIGGVAISSTAAELNYVDGVTSAIQTQLNAKAASASPTFSGTVSDGDGKIRAIPQSGSDKTSSYSLVVGDVGNFIGIGSGGSITVPNSTFAAGDAISIFNNTSGDRTITLSISTAYIAGTDGDVNSVTLASRGVCTILFISGTVCVVSGNVS